MSACALHIGNAHASCMALNGVAPRAVHARRSVVADQVSSSGGGTGGAGGTGATGAAGGDGMCATGGGAGGIGAVGGVGGAGGIGGRGTNMPFHSGAFMLKVSGLCWRNTCTFTSEP